MTQSSPSSKHYELLAVAGGIVVSLFLIRRRFSGTACRSLALLQGKTVIITGANTGIGKETALDLARREARVILACRDIQKGELAAKEIRKKTTDGEVIVKRLDLASMTSIREFAHDIRTTENRLDILINNAGVFQTPYMLTEDGFELQFGVNHLGHFLLTNLLLDLLKQTKFSRIVIVASSLLKRGHINFDDINSKKRYSKREAYFNSKLANALFSRELHKRLSGTDVSVYCLHPGIVNTELCRHFPYWLNIAMTPLKWLFFKTPIQGAQTTIHCAIAGELEGLSGCYYGNCKEEPWDEVARDDGVATKLWDISEQMTNVLAHS